MSTRPETMVIVLDFSQRCILFRLFKFQFQGWLGEPLRGGWGDFGFVATPAPYPTWQLLLLLLFLKRDGRQRELDHLDCFYPDQPQGGGVRRPNWISSSRQKLCNWIPF
eukprot:EG_transcript_14440